ncbi:MAG: translation initiation factor IF-2 N-terminal domain-containing protein, partial [Deltaproteobacteria bacterium]
MTKKRVYEFAKELEIENKDLIAHLETLGVSVKSHSSTLEDSDVERVMRLLRKGEPHGTEETRVKPTVIRRRSVQTPVEESIEEAVDAPVPVTDKKEDVTAAPVFPVSGGKEPEAKTAEPQSSTTEPAEATAAEPQSLATEPAEAKAPVLSVDSANVPSGAALKPSAQEARRSQPQYATIVRQAPSRNQATIVRQAPAPNQPLPGRGKTPTTVPQRLAPKPPFAARTPEVKRDATSKPAPAAPKPVVAPPFDDKNKKKGRAPVEVLMEDQPAVKKKAFIKKIVEKKSKRDDLDTDERPSRWKETKKAVVKMQKTAITVPKAVKRRIKVGETISVGELAKKMGVKVSEVINKLIALGMMATINQPIDCDAATLIATEFGYQVESSGMDYDEEIQK